jgi:hypothetical protein
MSRHGIPVFQSIKTNPARADISAEVNKEADALAVVVPALEESMSL